MSKPDFGSHGNTIRVRSGKYIDLVDPKEDQFDFSDIAGALSKICRFSGQTSEFYSVAEHCCHCAFQAIQDGLSQEVCACTLLHDCSEAFMGDVVRPLKVLLPYYKELELRMERVIGNKFGLDFEKHAVAIKEIDNAMLIAEKNRLASNEDEDHMIGQVSGDTITWFGEREVRSLRPDIKCWTPPEAEVIFTAYARFLGVVDFSLMPVER